MFANGTSQKPAILKERGGEKVKLFGVFLLLYVTTFAMAISIDMLALQNSFQESLAYLWESAGLEKSMVIIGFLLTTGYILILGLRRKEKR